MEHLIKSLQRYWWTRTKENMLFFIWESDLPMSQPESTRVGQSYRRCVTLIPRCKRVRLSWFGKWIMTPLPNPKGLDQFCRSRKLPDSPASISDYSPNVWTATVSGEWVVLHLLMVPHVISTKVESKASTEAAPTQHTLPFLIPPPLSKKQEQGRTRERKWRFERKMEDEVKASYPRSSFHQAQVILLLSMVMVSSWALISIIWIFSLKP